MRRATVAFLVLAATPAAAQQTTARFRPSVGTALSALTETRTVTTLFGLPAVPDGSAFETERRISTRRQVRSAAPGAVGVEVSVDSVRTRRRALPDGVWSDVAPERDGEQPARATVDERFRIVQVTTAGTGDSRVLRMLGASFIGVGFGFPAGPVAVGQTFSTGAALLWDVELLAEAGLPLRTTVRGDLALTLDSVVTMPADELAFFSFRGQLDPAASGGVDQAGGAAVRVTGGFAGRLIWSAGWHAFVSGAARLQIQGQIRTGAPADATTAAAEWDVTITHRVRP